eukprot:710283-Hanusia_phi.AAC.2
MRSCTGLSSPCWTSIGVQLTVIIILFPESFHDSMIIKSEPPGQASILIRGLGTTSDPMIG